MAAYTNKKYYDMFIAFSECHIWSNITLLRKDMPSCIRTERDNQNLALYWRQRTVRNRKRFER